jgi:hypothetical protein
LSQFLTSVGGQRLKTRCRLPAHDHTFGEASDAWLAYVAGEKDRRPSTVQKILVLLHGILKRAKRKGWVATNAAEDAERVTVRRSGDFNVLSSEAATPSLERMRRSSTVRST